MGASRRASGTAFCACAVSPATVNEIVVVPEMVLDTIAAVAERAAIEAASPRWDSHILGRKLPSSALLGAAGANLSQCARNWRQRSIAAECDTPGDGRTWLIACPLPLCRPHAFAQETRSVGRRLNRSALPISKASKRHCRQQTSNGILRCQPPLCRLPRRLESWFGRTRGTALSLPERAAVRNVPGTQVLGMGLD